MLLLSKKFGLIRFALFLFLCISAQAARAVCLYDSSGNTSRKAFFVKAYADVFYAFDFNEPAGQTRLNFLSNYNRHNEVNLNWGFIHTGIENARYRANVALQAGSFVTDNYAAEPAIMRNIYQANAGFSIDRNGKYWIDAGIFPSHIGFESTNSFENSTLSRSFVAETTPYYLSGVKLSGLPDSNWSWQIILCNGWQRMQRISGNSMLSAGTKLAYKTTTGFSLNWSTFVGTDDPDSTRRMRYFNNFYGNFTLGNKTELIAGFDFGLQQRKKLSAMYHCWFSPVLILKYKISEKLAATARAEYFNDANGIILPLFEKPRFNARSASLNIDFNHSENMLLRIECRWMNSSYKLFTRQDQTVRDNLCLLGSIAVQFGDK